ncbi:hypothetical protein SKAU_G00291730 [Synaphobranchus kaupii]|uniref:LITAF domain-containing protein n=1 Tax=Synaphobranchus kaupii TaxID=118154 RepID=A0A9Q1IK88_SYNKA|nr:hypothetical protein SKAU_G00291730 [Synaphobranchus kaupii]
MMGENGQVDSPESLLTVSDINDMPGIFHRSYYTLLQVPRMASSSKMHELDRIQLEMDKVLLQRQHLSDRQAILTVLEDFRKKKSHMPNMQESGALPDNASIVSQGDVSVPPHITKPVTAPPPPQVCQTQVHMNAKKEIERSLEMQAIKQQLAMLTAKVELQNHKDTTLHPKSQPGAFRDNSSIVSQGDAFVLPPIAKPVKVPPPLKPKGPKRMEIQTIKEQLAVLTAKEVELQDHKDMILCPKSQPEEAKRSLEIEMIKEQLAKLIAKEVELQDHKDMILYPKSRPGAFQDSGNAKPGIVPPPPKPAPQMILDLKDLPTTPSCTRCPACHEFIITETVFRAGSATWLVCVMSSLLGCVVGCCLIPFCTKCFKDVEHKCPKCRARIHITRKL